MEYWYEFIIKDRLKSESSVETYRYCIYNHIIPNIGNLKLIDLKKGHIKKLYQQIFDYSPSVAKILQTIITTSLKDAAIKNFIPTNVANGIKLPNKDEKQKNKEEFNNNYHTLVIDEKKTYTIEEISILIKASKNTPIYLHILFAALMGMRKSEINGIKYTDIDYLHRKLYVQRQLGRRKGIKKEEVAAKTFTKQEVQLKSKSSYRILDIPDLVFEAILEERKKYEARKNRRKSDFSMKAISKLLGHSSTMITFENYTDKNEIIQDCLEDLEPFIERVVETDKIKVTDCTDIETDTIMQEYYEYLAS